MDAGTLSVERLMPASFKGSSADLLEAELCRNSFKDFVKVFWEDVPGAGKLVWNWHLDVFCDELQAILERVFLLLPKENDLVVNVSPGTSKSTIFSVLLNPWTWTRMPECRHLSASHTDSLALDLSNKSRWVIKGDRYRAYYPEIELREDQDAKGNFANTLGGERLTCTVGGKSPTGRHVHVQVVDDPLDPKRAVSDAGIKAAREFMTAVLPSRKVDKRVSVMCLVMQRLHEDDPTGVVLGLAKKEGGAAVRHICLPAALHDDRDRMNVKPAELIDRYSADGLMDPVRLPANELKTFRVTLGEYSYAGQFRQSPVPPGGGVFKETYFSRRVRASPHGAKRVRYWDRASTSDGKGCQTAGVLMARDAEGTYYVENVESGYWEPIERNKRMRAVAIRDRSRYPNNEPEIWVEREGGSTNADAWLGIARSLDGFTVREHMVSKLGSKIARADPWSTQCAAGNVLIVDGGASEGTGVADWDVDAFIKQHLAFPTGTLKDVVDASSGAYAVFLRRGTGQYDNLAKFLSFGSPIKKGQLRIVIASIAGLEHLVIENRALLFSFLDPPAGHSKGEGGNGHERNGRQAGGIAGADQGAGASGAARAVAQDAGRAGGGLLVEQPGVSAVGDDRDGAAGVIAPASAAADGTPPHGLMRMLGGAAVRFADLDPAECQQAWGQPVEPFGVPAAELLMLPEHGKAIWSQVLRKRPEPAEVLLFADGGDRRALSVAMAVQEGLALPRSVIHRADAPGEACPDKAPNQHVFLTMRKARGLVVA